MPNRILHERICVSETIAALDAAEERFFYRLVVQCDDYGRFDARPAVLRARCFPLQLGAVSDADVAGWLDGLERSGLVWRYAAGGDRSYLQVTTWDRYQQTRAKRSKFPEPASDCNHMQADASNGSHMSPYPVYENREARSVRRESRSETPTTTRAGAREESAVATAVSSSSADMPESKRLVGDLLSGRVGFRESPDFWAALDALDTGIPLRTEVVKALDWLRDKRKPTVTARFVLGWLERAAEQLPPPAAAMPNGTGPAPPAAAPLPPTWPADRAPTPAAAELWTAALDALALHMSRGNFEAYLRDTRGLAVADGRLVVGVRNPLLVETIEQRFGALVRRTLADLDGAPPDVRLVVTA